ncbi:MAG: cysteine desulfurase [Chitinophagaceae bacterium]|nr:cysteine desulfurase [Chitinophagaceae bacterium]
MQRRIYFDNAATTALAPEVLDAMMPFLTEKYGNPSSIYSYGRECKLAIEKARKSVAQILNASPSGIFFTSGGTESSNAAITASVWDLGCKRIITSPIEHHAVLHTVEYLHRRGEVQVQFVRLLPNGHVDLGSLEMLLSSQKEKTLVTLMHANNEIGNLLDLNAVGAICEKYDAIFHSDTVQTVAHYDIDLKNTPVHFIAASAHKFHGPKGTGILYINDAIKTEPFIHGGGQERNMRAGTENVYGIVGFAKALEIAAAKRLEESEYIQSLKRYMTEQLRNNLKDVGFNGDYAGESLYTVLNVSLPKTEKSEMLLFNLDINNICASGGSACSSGAIHGSHVLQAVYPQSDRTAVRFSFSRFNTREEVDIVVETLKEFVG